MIVSCHLHLRTPADGIFRTECCHQLGKSRHVSMSSFNKKRMYNPPTKRGSCRVGYQIWVSSNVSCHCTEIDCYNFRKVRDLQILQIPNTGTSMSGFSHLQITQKCGKIQWFTNYRFKLIVREIGLHLIF